MYVVVLEIILGRDGRDKLNPVFVSIIYPALLFHHQVSNTRREEDIGAQDGTDDDASVELVQESPAEGSNSTGERVSKEVFYYDDP